MNVMQSVYSPQQSISDDACKLSGKESVAMILSGEPPLAKSVDYPTTKKWQSMQTIQQRSNGRQGVSKALVRNLLMQFFTLHS